jgi:DNA polymerase (family X)
MLALAPSLSILASIAALRGRQAEAADLSRVAEHLAAGAADATSPDSGVVREALARIRDIGPNATIDQALADIPQDLRRLTKVGGLDVEDVVRLHGVTGATSLGELLAALRDQQTAAALGADFVDGVQPAVERTHAGRPKVALGRAWDLTDTVVQAIREGCPEVEQLSPTGSLRRFAATVGDLEVLAASADPARTSARLLALPQVSVVLHASRDRVVLRLARTELTIRIVPPEAFVPRLVHLTGSAAHVCQLRARAAAMGLTLSADGLVNADGRPMPLTTEDALYDALDLASIAPELREGAGEVEAAGARALPHLVRRDQIRGDLHMHTDWSDGRDPIETMVVAAEALGYEYVAITDHSVSSAIARGLDIARLERQMEAVAAVRDAHPGITVLQGAEVDILADGSLDFPDAVLERLDVVLASLHDPAGHARNHLTARYVQAMRHPLVQIVTHPTNRLVPTRAGYDLDEPRLFDAAVDTGTILEIDGAPGHLDMDGEMARRAIAAGVSVSVDGDCHRAELLGRHMEFAVRTARRGWVAATQVVNALPLDGLRRRLTVKRRSG